MDDETEAIHAEWIRWMSRAFELLQTLMAMADREAREKHLTAALAEAFEARATLHVGSLEASPLREPGHVPLRLQSVLSLNDGRLATVTLIRRKAQGPFTALDAKRLAMLHAGCAWIHVDPTPETPRIEQLSPREREALQHFIAGRTEKEVAVLLGRSRHTVHAYVKRIYRTLGVRSRPELRRTIHETSASKPEINAVRRFTSPAGE